MVRTEKDELIIRVGLSEEVVKGLQFTLRDILWRQREAVRDLRRMDAELQILRKELERCLADESGGHAEQGTPQEAKARKSKGGRE